MKTPSRRPTTFRLPFLAAFLLVAFAVADSASAANMTWTTATSGNWSTPGNWTTGIPGSGDNASFATGANYTVTYDSVNPTFAALTVSNTAGFATTLDVSAALTATGAFTVTRALVNITSTGNLAVGTGLGSGSNSAQIGSSTVNIASGGAFTFGTATNNYMNNSTVNVSGNMLNSGSVLTVANDGNTSNLNVTGGAVSLNSMVVGNRGTGNVSITGGGSLATSGVNGISMGNMANVANVANINVTNGTLTTPGNVRIGVGTSNATYQSNTSTSTFTVNGGTVTLGGSSYDTYIGAGRVGILNVSSGSLTTQLREIIVGGLDKASLTPTGSAVASGALNVSGGNLTTAALRIGDSIVSAGANAGYQIAGNFTQTGGTVTTSLLSATNAAADYRGVFSTITFSGGTLITKNSTISNGFEFAVGNGTSAASLQLNGGTHSFANGLRLKNNAALSGNGTITSTTTTVESGARLGGNVTVSGTTLISGTLGVGNSPGVGNFETLTLLTGSTTEMEFNANPNPATPGTSFDTINVSTAVTYDGTLKLVFGGVVGDGTFDLFNFGALTPSGSFSAVTLFSGVTSIGSLAYNAGVWTGHLDLGYGSGPQDFTFTEGTGDLGVIPEPGTWALLAVGLTFLVVLRRREAWNRQ